MFDTVPKQARHIYRLTFDKYIKLSPERLSHVRMSNWKFIVNGNSNQWMPMSHNNSTRSQVSSSYEKLLENEVHYLQTTLPGIIAMMELENSPNLSIDTKFRLPNPSIAILITLVMIESPKAMQPSMHNEANPYAE